jgi:hopanoid biosynthesis associated RND transporter like protein HpnN
MSADGKPQGGASLLAYLLAAVVRLAIRRPWLSVAVGLLGIGLALYLGSTRLGYHTSRAALLDQREEYHRRWLKYVQEFGEQEDVVVVVQGDRRETIVPVLDEVVREISTQPKYFQAVLHEIDLTRLRNKGLYYLSTQELQTIDGFLDDVEPIVRGNWEWLSPGAMATGMFARLQQVRPEQFQQSLAGAQMRLAQIANSLLTALSAPGAYQSPWPELSGSATPLTGLTSHRLIIGNDRTGLVLLKLTEDTSQSFIRNSDGIAALRDLIGRIKGRHPDVRIGLTGLPIMEHDEMQRSQLSMSMATALSFAGVFLVLVAGFGGLRHSLMAIAALLMGMIWTLGYTTLVVGHLNILSSAFGAVLTGLGINYGIYFIARYLQLRKSRRSIEESLIGTAQSVGPGITISAMASAIAFLVAGLTEFAGVAELGLIAGGGILLCLLAAMTVLPATVKLLDEKYSHGCVPVPLDFHHWIRPFLAHPGLVLTAGVAGTAAIAFGMTHLKYDYNLLHLQPAGLESVELEQTLLSESKESVYFALSMATTPEDAAARKARFLQLPLVERVDEIATRFPTSLEQKRPIIEHIRNHLTGLPSQPPTIHVASPTELDQMLSALQPVLSANLQMAHFQQQFRGIHSLLGQLPPAEYYARLSEYQQRVAGDLLGRLHLLRSVANAEPPTPSDLPSGLVSRFVGRNGTHLLRIYVKGDLWDIENLRQFVQQVRSVDPEATGNPVQILEASEQMRRSYERAALYAVATILPVVFLSFGTFSSTLLAGLPLVLAMLQLFGLMGILDIPLNAANMIGLSLMVGMGMETGVLITHDYLRQRGRYRMSAATGVAVVLNTLTTMVGFAVLMVVDHRGLQSLGRMLTIGMGCCLFSSLVVLPALLVLLTRNRPTETLPEIPSGQTGQWGVESSAPAAAHCRVDAIPETGAIRRARPSGVPHVHVGGSVS